MRSFFSSLVFAILMFSMNGCKKATTTTIVDNPPGNTGTGLIDPATLKGSLVFQSNFEPPCAVTPINATTDKISGKDALLGSSNDWDAWE